MTTQPTLFTAPAGSAATAARPLGRPAPADPTNDLVARSPHAPTARQRIEQLGRWAARRRHVLPRAAAAVVVLTEVEEGVDARLVDQLLDDAVPRWCAQHGVAVPAGLDHAMWAIALEREASGEWLTAESEAVIRQLQRRRAISHHPASSRPRSLDGGPSTIGHISSARARQSAVARRRPSSA
jgi:hypothetical protein